MANSQIKLFSLKFSVSSICIVVTAVIYFALIQECSWKGLDGKGYSRIISSDGIGYYMYLPNIFLNKSIAHQTPDDRFIFSHNNRGVNKYTTGTALSMLPFFALGYTIAYIHKDDLDGYSFPFRKAVSLAGLFYFILGLIFMSKFLSLYNIRDTTIAAVLILISFGTNLITYAVLEPSMSHVYSFCFITSFLYFTRMLIVTQKTGWYYVMAFILGMVILIRPVNALIIFIVPFLAGSWFTLKKTLFLIFKMKSLLVAGMIFFCIMAVQPLLWYIQTGDFIIWSYKYEGFYFTHPQLWNFLFSFRKGLFIYTPMCLLSWLSIYVIYRRSRFEFISIVCFLLLLIYIFSSWWNWYYGPSFGQRVFVDYYGVISLLLALLLDKLRFTLSGKIIYSIAFILLAINLVQNHQYYKGIMSSWDMNFVKYKYIFFKTSSEYSGCLGGNDDIMLYNPHKKLVYQIKNDFETKCKDFNTSITTFDSSANSTVCDYSNAEFNTQLTIPVNKNFITKRELFVDVSLDRLELAPYSCSTALFVVELSDSAGKNYFYYPFHINEVPSNEINVWKTFKYSIEIPRIRSVYDKMKVYIWNVRKMPFYIDNFNVSVYTID